MNDKRLSSEEIVEFIYLGVLGRKADKDGLATWKNRLDAGLEISKLIEIFTSTDEYKKTFGGPQKLSSRDSIVSEFLQHCKMLTIVDVGAQALETEKHVYHDLLNIGSVVNVIGFEPIADKVVMNDPTNPNLQYSIYPFFIGDGKAQKFYLNDPDTTSSLLPLNFALTSTLDDLKLINTIKEESIISTTLDNVLKQEGVVHFLKLDIQGFELEALKAAKEVLSRTCVIHCEVSFLEIYKDQSLFSEVESFLRSQGFQFIDFSHMCKYSLARKDDLSSRDILGWGDAIFFKKPESLPFEGFIIQSLIASVVYDKHSLAADLFDQFITLKNEAEGL